jgi:Secretion system C-terminal sorting domain
MLLGSFPGLGFTPNRAGQKIFGVDTSGTVIFQQFYAPDLGYGFIDRLWESETGRRTITPTPTGYLTPFTQSVNTPFNVDAGLLRTDRRGQRRTLWQSRQFYQGAPVPDRISAATFLLDGSLLSVGGTYNVRGTSNNIYFGTDYWLLRHHPATLDTIETRRVGLDQHYEEAYDAQPTRDGGVVLIGAHQQNFGPVGPPPGEFTGEQAEIVKLDSALRLQWRHRINGGYGTSSFGVRDNNCHMRRVQPTQDGGYVVMGWRTFKKPNRMAIYCEGVVQRLDSLGALTWEQRWAPPFVDGRIDTLSTQGANFFDWAYNPDGTVVILGDLFGSDVISFEDVRHRWVLKLAGLSAPWEPDYCRRPPAAPRLSGPVQQPQVGAFVFPADSTTAAGPRYAALSLCTWDWGDGSPLDTGWVGQHRYLSPAAVRVRQCVTNNLFCQACTDYYPLGYPNGLAEELAAGISVYPNPSATGVFGVRTGTASGAQLTVFDGVGRQVWHGAATGGETRVELSGQPAGLYLLRLTWADGRSVTKKLLR